MSVSVIRCAYIRIYYAQIIMRHKNRYSVICHKLSTEYNYVNKTISGSDFAQLLQVLRTIRKR